MIFSKSTSSTAFKTYGAALAGWVSGLERCVVNQRATGLIPSQATGLGCRPGPWLGCLREATN